MSFEIDSSSDTGASINGTPTSDITGFVSGPDSASILGSTNVSLSAGAVIVSVPVTIEANATGTFKVNILIDEDSVATEMGDDVLLSAYSFTATITVDDPGTSGFSIFYKVENGAETNGNTYKEVDPDSDVTVGVYVINPGNLTLQAFDIFPVYDDVLSYVAGSATASIAGAVVTDKMSDTNKHIQMVGEDSKPINVGTDEVKIAEFQLHLSADAVYGEHYNIYFSDDSNATTLAVGATPEEALIADIDTTGTMGVEILKTVTITFNGNGGKTEENDTSYTQDDVPYNKATNLYANAFSRDGYSFKGWSTTVDPADDADINYANSASVTTKTDLTLYAVWTPADVNYTVKHLQQNTDLSTYAEVEADRETKQGKTGAQTEAEAKTYDGFTDQTITQQTIAADGSTVVEIKYDRNTYTVTFNANGGSTPTPESKTVTYGLPYGELADTTYTGKTFLGWFTAAEGGDQVTASTVFEETNSQTLYAHWTNQTIVSFDANGGTGTIGTMQGDAGSSINLPAQSYEKTGYHAPDSNQWRLGDAETGTEYSAGAAYTLTSENVTFYAQWAANTYTVKYDANGGTGTMEDQSFSYGESKPLTANAFVKEHYNFLGWSEDASATTATYADEATVSNLTAEDGGEVTLYAVWEAMTYTVTVQPGTGSFDDGNGDTEKEVGVGYNEPIPSGDMPGVTPPVGYDFGGWFIDGDPSKPFVPGTTLVTGDITVIAQYTPHTYTITFVLDGGTDIAVNVENGITAVNTMSYTIQSTYSLPSASGKANHSFVNWKVTAAPAAGEGNWTDGETINGGTALDGKYGDVTLTAQWTSSIKAQVQEYKYAYTGYKLLLVDASDLGETEAYTFDGKSMYWTDDTNYQFDGSTAVYYTLIKTSSSTTLSAEEVAKISTVTVTERPTITYDGDVNGDGRVNVADANAVYQMVQNGGHYYGEGQLSVEQRLAADMDKDTTGQTNEYRGSIKDVDAIVTQINEANA